MTPDDHVPRRAVLADDASLALMKRVAAGVPEAQEELAERLVMRVRRGAHALMRGSSDADDSAQLALIEILRSARDYVALAGGALDFDALLLGGSGHRDAAATSVERWADRIVGRSVIRFSRAIRRRAGAFSTTTADDESTLELSDRPPRNLDECLARLPSTAREALLLRHAFGQSIEEIAELTQVSPDTVRDRLLLARKEFRRLAHSRVSETRIAAPARRLRGAS
jgi:RNA polymerase sigma-70 factor (ECF subfamily)